MASFRQDMPPSGGYGPVEWARAIPRKGIRGSLVFAGFVVYTVAQLAYYTWDRRKKKRYDHEKIEGRIILEPFLMAEQERLHLIQLRKNVDEEIELTKDVEGWEVGKLWNEPIYHNPTGGWIETNFPEYYVHSGKLAWEDRYMERIKR